MLELKGFFAIALKYICNLTFLWACGIIGGMLWLVSSYVWFPAGTPDFGICGILGGRYIWRKQLTGMGMALKNKA